MKFICLDYIFFMHNLPVNFNHGDIFMLLEGSNLLLNQNNQDFTSQLIYIGHNDSKSGLVFFPTYLEFSQSVYT